MTNFKLSKSSYDSCAEIVKQCKHFAKLLLLAVSEQDNPTKVKVDATIAEKSKHVETAKERYKKATEELDNLTQQVEAGRSRVDNVSVQLKTLEQDIKILKETESTLRAKSDVETEDPAKVGRIRWQLKLHKMITGVHFEFNLEEDYISGFVAIKGDEPDSSNLLPFSVKKNTGKIPDLLWEKIRESSVADKNKENVIF